MIHERCYSARVLAPLKTLLQIAMAILALGVYSPDSACASDSGTPVLGCCCGTDGACDCPVHTPDKSGCTVARSAALDKQLSARTVSTTSLRNAACLFSIAPASIKYLAFVPQVPRRDVNVSPPFGGSTPQALLRLWLI
jgi:hypothetical protein